MQPRSHTCPRCGAPVGEGARRCSYCAAPIAAARCASCFHMNFADAAHCSGCGRELGLEPIAEPGSLRCPDCREPLSVIHDGPGDLHDCAGCCGQFVEHALLRELIQRREAPEVGGAPPPSRAPIVEGAVRYRPCPACGQLMNRKNFGGTSGVIVDSCKAHGTWFDRGELPRVLAFVAAGGMERARRREAELREQARKSDVALRAGTAAALDEPPGARLDPELAVLMDLLGYLRDLIPRRKRG